MGQSKRSGPKIENLFSLNQNHNTPTQTKMYDNTPNSRFTIDWYVNGQNTSTCYNMTAQQAYDNAIPGEALLPTEGSRWHVMMRSAALQKMAQLNPGETFKVCFQDPHVNPEYDTEMITITRVIVP
jgi:hypothetical protein